MALDPSLVTLATASKSTPSLLGLPVVTNDETILTGIRAMALYTWSKVCLG